MKQYFAKHPNGNITTSNYPIKETGAESFKFEVEEEDQKAVELGEKDWKIAGTKLSVVASTRKAEQEAKALEAQAEAGQKKAQKLALIKKVTEGVATKEEQEEFANLL